MKNEKSKFLLATLLVCAGVLALPIGADAEIPELDATEDRQHQSISGRDYVVKPKSEEQNYTIKGWHGSNFELEFDRHRNLPLWLASFSTNSLGAARKKIEGEGGDIWMYLFEIPVGKYVMLPADSLRGLAIAKQRGLRIDTPLIGNTNIAFSPQVGGSEFCNGDYIGWRSPWDQDEFMVCPEQKVAMFERESSLRAVITCDGEEMRANYEVGTSYIFGEEEDVRVLKSFDMFLQPTREQRQVGIVELIKAVRCEVIEERNWGPMDELNGN